MSSFDRAFEDIGDILLLQRLDPVLDFIHTNLRINTISEILSYLWLKQDAAEFSAQEDSDLSYTDLQTFIRQRNTELASRKIYVETARAIVFEINELAKSMPNTLPITERRVIATRELSEAYKNSNGNLNIRGFYDPETNKTNYDSAVAILKQHTNSDSIKLIHNKAARISAQLKQNTPYNAHQAAKDFLAVHRFKTTEIVNKLLTAYKSGSVAKLDNHILSTKLSRILATISSQANFNIVLNNKYIALAEFPNYAKKISSSDINTRLNSISDELVKRMKAFESTSIANARDLLTQIKASNGNLYFIRIARVLNSKKLGDKYSTYNPDWIKTLINIIKNLLWPEFDSFVCDYCKNLHGQIKHASIFLSKPTIMPPSHPHCRCKLYPINGDYIPHLQKTGIKIDTSVATSGGALDKKAMKKYAKKFMEQSKSDKGKTSWLNPVVVGSILAAAALAGVYAFTAYKKSIPTDIPDKIKDVEIKPIQREPIPVSRWLEETPKFVSSADYSTVNVDTTRLTLQIMEAKDRLRQLFDTDKYDDMLYNLRITSNDAFVYLLEKYKPYGNIMEAIKRGESIQDFADNNAAITQIALFGDNVDEHSSLLNTFIRNVLPRVHVYDDLSPEDRDKILQDVRRLIDAGEISIRGTEGKFYENIDNFPFAATHIITRRSISELYNKVKPKYARLQANAPYNLDFRIAQARNMEELAALAEELQAALHNLRLLDNFFIDYLSEGYRFIPESKKQARLVNIMNLFMHSYPTPASPLKNGGIPNYTRITYLETRNRLINIIDRSIEAFRRKLFVLLSQRPSL